MELLNNLLYFVITIGVLVFVHELGHFLAAKACRMRVDRFSIGFPPRAFGKKIGDTDYCVSWIPIGGYVKIAGMIDESFDTNFINTPAQPWEFRSKPVWQRIIVITAGVIMNILLAIAIFWGITYIQGESYMQTTQIGYVTPSSAAEKIGLVAGDKIISINEKEITHWEAIQTALYVDNLGKDLNLVLDRESVKKSLYIHRAQIPDISESAFGIYPTNTEAVISDVLKGKPAEKAGLRGGDIILSLNEQQVFNEQQVIKIIRSNPQKPVAVEWKRNGEAMRALVTPSSDGLIGIGIGSRYTGSTLKVKFGFFESLPKGIRETMNATLLFAHSIGQIATGKISFSKSVGGPIKIAQVATRTAEIGIMSFLAFMALLSISLAVMNILPFPALDGGHLIILLYEAVFRKPLPHKVQQVIQQVGVAILFAFTAFVIYNDIFGL